MKIFAFSDGHGYLPQIPKCDLLIIAGDICPTTDHSIKFQKQWLDITFRYWINRIDAEEVVGVGGNHDWIFQKKPDLVPKLRWTYLQDSSCGIDGLKIYGIPWTNFYNNWAFNLPDELNNPQEYKIECDKIFGNIPFGLDILISHGPPLGILDRIKYGNLGSYPLLEEIRLKKPKVNIFGHIHDAYGQYQDQHTKYYNVSLLNDQYRVVNKVTEIIL